jgi:hypothetical protein
MRAVYLRNVAIAVLVLSVGLIFLSGQTSQASAYSYYDGCYDYCGYNYYNVSSYWGYYYGSPYYYSGYPYYSNSYSCYYGNYYGSPYGGNYYGYPYYGYSYQQSPPKYQLTVSTDPANLGTASGNGTYTSGSSATFAISQGTVQTSPNMRYVFSHWSGDFSGVGTSGSLTMNSAMHVTAVYQLQYHLAVSVQPTTAPLPDGVGWYNVGDTLTLSVNGQMLGGQDGSRLVFQGWTVDGKNVQSGVSLPLTMDSAHAVTAQYKQQYYLTVRTDQGTGYGEGWYDAGSAATIYASTPVSTSYGVKMVFNGWQGDIQTGSQSATVLMDGPKTVIASWGTDPTVLNLTIALGIIAAFLIAGGIIAYAVLNRRGYRTQPAYVMQPQGYTPANYSDSPPLPRKGTTTTTTTTTTVKKKTPPAEPTEPTATE